MDFIDKKKIHKGIMIALLFLSFGFAEWQSTRGVLAYMSYSYPELAQATWLFNDAVAFLMGGAVPLIFYEFITAFAARFAAPRTGGASDDLKYALRFFYIAANLVIGALKFIYYAHPIASVFGNIWIDFVVATVFFALYLWYCAKRYVDKTHWGSLFLTVGGTYLIVQALLTVFGLLTGVLLA